MEAIKGMLSQMQAFEQMVEQQKQVIEDKQQQDAAAEAEAAAKRTKLAAAVDCAYLIASADGTASAEELGHIADKTSQLTDGRVDADVVQTLVSESAAKCDHDGRDGCIEKITTTLGSEEERVAAFMVAAAVSWTGGGITTQEGLALQAIAKAFGWEISHMHKLLGKARG